MKDREIDGLIKIAVQNRPALSPALLERIAGQIKPTLRPVRPMAPAWLLTGSLILISVAVALAGTARAGFFGIELLTPIERALIFPALVLFLCIAARELAAAMIPGSRRLVPPGALAAISCLVLMVIFAGSFRDYHTTHFVAAGVSCLAAGMVHALPVALLSWLLLRRGFALNPVAAGAVAGTLAGLAGVTMLELHCPNFQLFHVLVWHTAVIPFCGAAGALVSQWFSKFR